MCACVLWVVSSVRVCVLSAWVPGFVCMCVLVCSCLFVCVYVLWLCVYVCADVWVCCVCVFSCPGKVAVGERS